MNNGAEIYVNKVDSIDQDTKAGLTGLIYSVYSLVFAYTRTRNTEAATETIFQNIYRTETNFPRNPYLVLEHIHIFQ